MRLPLTACRFRLRASTSRWTTKSGMWSLTSLASSMRRNGWPRRRFTRHDR